MIEIFEALVPSETKPRLVIEFPLPKEGPALEAHLWLFKGRTQLEWVTEDGVGLGVVWAAEC